MNKNDESLTLQKILKAAEPEFLKKGFQKASLREIVKKAGVTTGAFYGYFKSKEKLFDFLVKEPADYLLNAVKKSEASFESLPENEQQKSMSEYTEKILLHVMDYLFENKNQFRLIIKCSAGTKYEDFANKIAKMEEASTLQYIKVLAKTNPKVLEIQPITVQIVSRAMVNSILEPILYNVPVETAKQTVKQICKFYEFGWLEMFK